MKNKIVEMVMPIFVNALLKSFSKDEIKRTLDDLIDRLEEYIRSTETKVDDGLLPIVYFVRNIFDIPDLPDKDASP